ncbi:MAG: ABC transporter permease [Chloroflexi bacterium]|nr:ABC transporter permease [Chloroflexota bacterium]
MKSGLSKRLEGLRSIGLGQALSWTLPIWAVLIAFLVGSVIIAGAGANPIQAYAALFRGAVGNGGLVATTLVKSIPLMLAGLSVVLAYRASVFNIGGEGQIYMGALFAVWGGTLLHLPAGVHLPIVLALGMVGGFLWSAIPGYLKAARGFNEVIVTIFMNYIAVAIVSYLVHGPMRESGWNYQSRAVDESARLPIILPGTSLHLGLVVALAAAVLAHILLFHTTLGYRLRMVGFNAEAARYAGVKVTLITVLAMALSGALAGLAGAVEIAGVQFRLLEGFSPGWGFDAIAVALVGQLHPAGVLLAALFFGALRTGANSMQTAVGLPMVVVQVIQGLTVLFMMIGAAVQHYGLWRPARREK